MKNSSVWNDSFALLKIIEMYYLQYRIFERDFRW